MRIWLGKEQEFNGNYNNVVAFVEAKEVNLEKLLNILQSIDVFNSIKTIYFGAGEVNVTKFIYDENSITFLKDNGIQTVLELDFCSDTNFNSFHFDTVIYRFNMSNRYDNLQCSNMFYKIRESERVGLVQSCKLAYNDISKVKDGRYPEDILIYDK